jgi:hypothetical protein
MFFKSLKKKIYEYILLQFGRKIFFFVLEKSTYSCPIPFNIEILKFMFQIRKKLYLIGNTLFLHYKDKPINTT